MDSFAVKNFNEKQQNGEKGTFSFNLYQSFLNVVVLFLSNLERFTPSKTLRNAFERYYWKLKRHGNDLGKKHGLPTVNQGIKS